MGRFDSLYARLPLWAQNLAVSAYGGYWYWLRFGGGYRQALQDCLARETWTQEQWQGWQQNQLQRLLPAAAQHVPYYRETWNASEKAAALAGRLSELPLLAKEPLRAAPHAFLREDLKPHWVRVADTSGSTGTPIKNYRTAEEIRVSLAWREARSAGWAGVSFELPRATFSGRLSVPDAHSSGPFHRFNYIERQVYLSAFHLRAENARAYVNALAQHRVEWLTGYAVSYFLLAQFILEQKLQPPPLKALVTTSEKVTREMRTVLEQAYQCPVYEEYSSVENVFFASQCAHGRLHLSPDAGLVEILRPDGQPCGPDEPGEVVVTGLARTYQPLIRYCLGDWAKWDGAPCPCGRQMPVLKEILGRSEDVVVGPDGRKLVRFHGIFVDQPHVREGQIIQETLHRLRVRVVPVNGFGPADTADIIRRVQQRLGDEVEVIVQPVAAIPRTKAGKFQAVISQLKQIDH
jgi:phenylacetate-CoA ligase